MESENDFGAQLIESILRTLPVGLYQVEERQGEEQIVFCNEEFARIFEYSSAEELVGTDIKRLYMVNDYAAFKQELSQGLPSSPLLGYMLRLRTRSGETRVVEVNSRVISDANMNTIGRIGTIRDITQESELRKRVELLTKDIGGVLHAYTSTLLMVNQAIAPLADLLGPKLHLQAGPDLPIQALAALEKPISALHEALRAVLRTTHDRAVSLESAGKKISPSALLAALDQLSGSTQHPMIRIAVTRQVAAESLKYLSCLGEFDVPEVQVHAAQSAASEVARICAQLSLRDARQALLSMDHEVRVLRDYITAGVRTEEPKARVTVRTLISQAIAEMMPSAEDSGLIIRMKDECPDEELEINVRDVRRALVNLLHNAVKYSWRHPGGRAGWINVQSSLISDQVKFSIESYGVPIAADEIRSGAIFAIGYRGRYSGERGRLGTGIGLADARRVAEANGGNLSMSSVPVSQSLPEDDSTITPYLTTAVLSLPAAGKRGDS